MMEIKRDLIGVIIDDEYHIIPVMNIYPGELNRAVEKIIKKRRGARG
jgi:hypothetical protein